MKVETSKSGFQNFNAKLGQQFQTHIIGPIEKRVEAARLQAPPAHVIDGIDLKVLPKFICYKAALLREKLFLQTILALVTGAFIVFFVASRIEVTGLYSKLRSKEFILAPGVRAGYGSELDDEDLALYQRGRKHPDTVVPKGGKRVVTAYVYPHELPTRDYFWGGYVSLVVGEEDLVFQNPEEEAATPGIQETKKKKKR